MGINKVEAALSVPCVCRTKFQKKCINPGCKAHFNTIDGRKKFCDRCFNRFGNKKEDKRKSD